MTGSGLEFELGRTDNTMTYVAGFTVEYNMFNDQFQSTLTSTLKKGFEYTVLFFLAVLKGLRRLCVESDPGINPVL